MWLVLPLLASAAGWSFVSHSPAVCRKAIWTRNRLHMETRWRSLRHQMYRFPGESKIASSASSAGGESNASYEDLYTARGRKATQPCDHIANFEDSLPDRIRQEVNLVWLEINSNNRLVYLPSAERTRLREILIVFASMRLLLGVVIKPPADDHSKYLGMPSAELRNVSIPPMQPSADCIALAPVSGVSQGSDLSRLVRRVFDECESLDTESEHIDHILDDLDRCIETLQIVIDCHADIDTLSAVLALNFLNLEDKEARQAKLEAVRQCDSIVLQIVKEVLDLRDLFDASSIPTHWKAHEYRTLFDLEQNNARFIKETLLENSNDVRALLIYIAGLLYTLRNQYRMSLHERNVVALECLQLYAPVAHALGLGSQVREMEELSYRALFPDSYECFASWHKDFREMSAIQLAMARDRIVEQLEKNRSLRRHLERYEIQGRVKGVVSAFKKTFRKDQLPEQLHDLLGLRIILEARPATRLLLRQVASAILNPSRALPARSSAARPRRGRIKKKHRHKQQKRQKVEVVDESEPGDENGAGVALSYADLRHLPSLEEDLDAWLCDQVYDMVTEMWEEVPGRYKDYVRSPKQNGYQSIHSCVYLMSGCGMAEVQVRTVSMHDEAEYGLASHDLYKGDITSTENAQAWKQRQLQGRQLLLPSTSSGAIAPARSGGQEAQTVPLTPKRRTTGMQSGERIVRSRRHRRQKA